MTPENEKYLYKELTKRIIGTFHKVYNTLGYDFLEKMYENALVLELKEMGFKVDQQKPIKGKYTNVIIGDYYADIVVNSQIILEIKAIKKLQKAHSRQLINYLKSTDLDIGLLLNFGKKPEVVRKIFTN